MLSLRILRQLNANMAPPNVWQCWHGMLSLRIARQLNVNMAPPHVWQHYHGNNHMRITTAGTVDNLHRDYSTVGATTTRRQKMLVPTPKCLLSPLRIPSRLLLGPGPSNCPPRVLHALSRPVLGHLHPEFCKVMDDVKAGLRYAFQTEASVVCCVSGTGHCGMEAVINNILQPGETILIACNGIWGHRAADMARRQGVVVRLIEVPGGETFSLETLEEAVALHRPSLVFVVQGESSTGVLQKIEDIGPMCRKYSTLLAVDTVASLCGVPFYMDEWKVDVTYTGSQKVLGAPPSLSPIAFNDRAWKKVKERSTPITSYYSDVTHLANYWQCGEEPRRYHHTGPISAIYALREALAILAEQGLDATIRRHSDCSKRLYSGLEELSLVPYVDNPINRLPTVTTIKIPPGINWQSVTQYLMNRHQVEISGGLGPTAGQVFRIGLMGYNCTEENVDLVLMLLKEALTVVTIKNKL